MFIPIFTAVMSILALYVCLRLIMPLPVGLGKRLLVCAAVVLVANRFIVQRQFGLVLPDTAFLVVAWLHAAIVLAFALALVTDILGLILRIAGVRLPSLARCVALAAASLGRVENVTAGRENSVPSRRFATAHAVRPKRRPSMSSQRTVWLRSIVRAVTVSRSATVR